MKKLIQFNHLALNAIENLVLVTITSATHEQTTGCHRDGQFK